jgi:hypothetical protein
MYFTDEGFVISAREITAILVIIVMVSILLKILYGKICNTIVSKYSEDYPGSTKFADMHEENRSGISTFSDISDVYRENRSDIKESDLDIERQEKVIFEEIISNVIFRYDEKTKMLTIGERSDISNAQPIKMKLNSGIEDLREFVDRLEEYVNE